MYTQQGWKMKNEKRERGKKGKGENGVKRGGKNK